MKEIFEDYLFSQGYFVADPSSDPVSTHAAEALVALGRFAQIRITAHPERANLAMLKVAERNIGCNVPPAFYQGFPQSVLALSPTELLVDQMLYYLRTYGTGDFSQAGHSLFEECYERAAFDEAVEPKDFVIITLDEAEELLARMAKGFLSSTRPLNDANYQLLKSYLETHPELLTGRCACKDTGVLLIIDTNDPSLAHLIEMPDVIRLVEWLHERRYQEDRLVSTDYSTPGAIILTREPASTLRKLNLKNQDRKLITAVLDRLFERGGVNTSACLEKKRAWNGLLHHIHYRPRCAEAEAFCRAMRSKEQRSVYSTMEKCLAKGDVRGATDALREGKGPAAVLRHLDYLLSRARDEDVAYVLDACQTGNKIVLLQLLLNYGVRAYLSHADAARDFTFVHNGRLTKHHETEEECARRKSFVPAERVERVVSWLSAQFESACHGTLGAVYVDDTLHNAALPLQEGASMGGFGTLPRGTRIPLPAGKKVRAFTYWEKVDDIDLSCLVLDDKGKQREFSWRNMSSNQSNALVFSGDETSGYDGGSEYFDVDAASLLCAIGSSWHYLVFCNNVFSGCAFDQCVCRAGYMLRDLKDSGEVFEPATVQTSFIVNCASRAAYLFALDLQDLAIIWLNLGEDSLQNIAGESDKSFLLKYLHTIDVMNLHTFAQLLATRVVYTPAEADVVFSDEPLEMLNLREDQELIRSRDTARLLELLN